MMTPDPWTRFAGSIPEIYERHLVPMLFEPYAIDLVLRTRRLSASRILEVAAGTGVVTRALATALPGDVTIVATDLNAPMIERALRAGAAPNVEWRPADASELPFADAAFDVVVCQFGVMFFPDRPKAYAEALRVLKPGGVFLFNAWDRIEENDFPQLVQRAVDAAVVPDPPQFLARIPHGYFDVARIERDLAEGGFAQRPAITTVAKRSRAESARFAAVGFCHGTPLRNDLESRDSVLLDEVTDLATALIAQRFGRGEIDGRLRAHVVEARK